MKKLPMRQIFFLSIFVMSIFALSAYSTYAIFTLESETSDIVSIHTPNSLNILTDKYEYKVITISKNAYVTTDIDIYNTQDARLCYSVWYKPVKGSNIDTNKIKIYQNSDSLSTTGIIENTTNKRISLFITNDNDVDVDINVGLAYAENNGTCELNISNDKLSINEYMNNPKVFTQELISNQNVENIPEGYLIYENNNELEISESIYISDKYTYTNELFTLEDPQLVTKDKLRETISNKTYYTCLNETSCKYLYQIITLNENNNISKYNKYVGYLAGETGLKKVGNSYIYFGDNPNNYIYYNCKNYLDKNTCELWRIMGITYDEDNKSYLTKIIRNDYLDKTIYSNKDSYFNSSVINKYLNEELKIDTSYLKELTYKEIIVNDLKSNLNNIKYVDKEIKNNITIMTLLDYLNASFCNKNTFIEYDKACLTNNWLNNGALEWTSTIKTEMELPNENSEEESQIALVDNIVYAVSDDIKEINIDTELPLRPVAYLNSHTFLMSGTGTFDDPYMIK